MTDQITVPRATWDAMREALDGIEHFSDAVDFKSDPLSRGLRQWINAGRAALTAANAVNKFEAARSKRVITDEMLNFGARGLLASLTFWPHMTEEDSDELAEFLAKYMRESAANAVSHPKPETAPATEGGAITSESAANAVSAEPKVKLISTAQEMGTPVQPQYSIDADPQGIRARVVSAVVGAMAYGASNTNKPPEGHWLNEVWDIARAEANRVQPQATEPAPKKLIGWRTADYLRETTDRQMAKDWEVHYEVLPIFEGDANTKLAAAPKAKQ